MTEHNAAALFARLHTLDPRFAASIEVDSSGCWRWLLGKDRDGYGRVKRGGRNRRPHRYILELFGHHIPEGYEVDHLCKVRDCSYPPHLEAVPPIVNLRRSDAPPVVNARATHCHRGHPLSGDNLYIAPNDPGRRGCKACRDNTSRQVYLQRTACRVGHPYPEESQRDTRGRRVCAICRAAAIAKTHATRYGKTA